MIFSSPEFILLFLPIAFLGYFYLNRLRLVLAGKAWLVIMSFFFYSYWSIVYLPLLLASIFFNFAVGTALTPNPSRPRETLNKAFPFMVRQALQPHSRRYAHERKQGLAVRPEPVEGLNQRFPRRFSRCFVLIGSIAANLALLGYFKYANFLIDNINLAFNVSYDGLPQLLLPLGISFYTFTQIAYLIDSYRGAAEEYDFLSYALFVTFFPHLIAGPILHHREMMTQFESRWTWVMRYRNIFCGLFIFSIGLFKKVIIADTFANWADAGFDSETTLDFFSAWATSLSYTFQIYFDFSGYCDMAIGASLLFNIWLPINFNSPYKASDIRSFWRRWHMTLSRYLRDYIYIPLGGNRCSTVQVCFNLMATFLLGGLWHGAGWMYIIWGALHGTALVMHRAWSGSGLRMPKAVAWMLTFNFVNITWVFFRAKTPDDALRILREMANIGSLLDFSVMAIPTSDLAWGGWFSDYLLNWLPVGMAANARCFGAIMLALVIISQKNSLELMAMSGHGMAKLSGALLLFCIAMYSTMVTTSTVFLYFNF